MSIKNITLGLMLTLLLGVGAPVLANQAEVSAREEFQEPQHHIIIDHDNYSMTVNDGYGESTFKIAVAKSTSLRIPKGVYTIDKYRISNGVTHFSGWGNPNLMAWYAMPIIPMVDGKPVQWTDRTMVPVIHTEPDNCYGLQSLIARGANLEKNCPGPIKIAPKGWRSNGCLRLDEDKANGLYNLVLGYAQQGKYVSILVK